MKAHASRYFAVFLIAAIAMLSYFPAPRATYLTNLRCEYLADPLGYSGGRNTNSLSSGRRGQLWGWRG